MHPLHDISISTLGSGSRGNCTFIGNTQKGVLVDCGLSTRQILKRIHEQGLSSNIIGVLITHEHSDHIGAARILEKSLNRDRPTPVPFFMTEGTARNIPTQCKPQHIVCIEPDRPFRLDDWMIEPVSVPHDTADPICFTVQASSVRVGVITDLGHVTHRVARQLGTLDAAVLEFNHDAQMLEYGHYPQRLKERVRGPYGHLSNSQAADLVKRGARRRLQHIILAHLSADNNTIDKAYLACQSALSAAGLGQTKIHVATQQVPLPPVTICKEHSGITPKPTRPRIANRKDQPTLFPDL